MERPLTSNQKNNNQTNDDELLFAITVADLQYEAIEKIGR